MTQSMGHIPPSFSLEGMAFTAARHFRYSASAAADLIRARSSANRTVANPSLYLRDARALFSATSSRRCNSTAAAPPARIVATA